MTDYFRVAAPLVSLKIKDPMGAGWQFQHVYQGGVVRGEDVEPENLAKHLEGFELVPYAAGPPEPGADPVSDLTPEDLVAVPAGTPILGEPPNVPVTETSGASVDHVARLDTAAEVLGVESPTASAAPAGSGERYPEGDPDDSWTIAQLQAYAGDNEVDLQGAKVKGDILAKIDQARDES